MIEIIGAIAPVFALIVLGHVLSRTLLTSAEFWGYCDRLTYWVLFPALLFNKISVVPLDARFLGPYAGVLVGGFVAAVAFALLAARIAGLPGPIASSVLQGAARHNTFIALAVAERLYAANGLAIAALASSILIPITNIVIVTAMVVLHPSSGDGRAGRAIARDLTRNPLLVAVFAGLLFNVAGLARLPVLHETTDLLGRAALPVALLSIGAGIRIGELAIGAGATSLALAGKLTVFPLAILLLALATGLERQPAQIAMIFGAVPTASSAYALARQMGGDAPLMARIVTVETAATFMTMPLTLIVAGWVMG